ncbi:hypothetical protein [Thermocatellispora tengchongensis]|uniref:hypothetical protein n=1 Tax=Thermocatellispora tengchongensis TaxID=1073253 RepID=UPI00362EC872
MEGPDSWPTTCMGVKRPRIKPALRQVLRSERTLQIGLHPRRAAMLHNTEPRFMRLVRALDGTRDVRQILALAQADGLTATETISLLHMLIRRGVIDDAAAQPVPLRPLGLAERDRLQPDLDALSLDPASTDCGFGAFARRRAAYVRVYGAGRIGAQVVALLAAAGIGHLCVSDPVTALAADVVPGGLGWSEVGGTRQDGAAAVARRIAPGVNVWTGEHAASLDDRARPPTWPCCARPSRWTTCSWPS